MKLTSWRGRQRARDAEKSAFTTPQPFTKAQAKDLTRTRKAFALTTSALYFLAFLFLILVQIGNTHNKHILTDWFLFKIDISDIAITSYTGSAVFTNSLAQTVGLHDYYQVGLWGWCEGYDNSQGTVFCSKPEFAYWFNPVDIILSELFAGATITLPTEIYTYLNIIRVASQAMFGCFFAGIICAFLNMFLTPLTLYSRLLTVAIGVFAVLSSLVIIVGAVISTAMWSIFTHVINTEATGLGITPTTGREMLAFMWIAAGAALIAAVIQLSLMCCCTSRRDVKHGKKKARKAMLKLQTRSTDDEASREAEPAVQAHDHTHGHGHTHGPASEDTV